MKNIKYIGLWIIAVLFLFTSCSKDDDMVEKKRIGSELASILSTKGFTIEGDMLVADSKVTKTKKLDLSNTHLTTVPEGLEVFPNLEFVNFANNDFEVSFDFSKLPTSVKGVDLSNNKIYEYNGLVNVDFDKKEINVLREMDKLILPYTAKYNVESLPYYYRRNKDIDMQMQEKDGNLKRYNTLREVPDLVLRLYLKKHFKSRFRGNRLDIGSFFAFEEEENAINLNVNGGFWGDDDLAGANFSSLEGIEYLLNDSRWRGTFSRAGEGEALKPYKLGYVKLGSKLSRFESDNITYEYFDTSNARSLNNFVFKGDTQVTKLDLSKTKIAGRGAAGSSNLFAGGVPDNLTIKDCPNLEEIILPDFSKMEKKPVSITSISLENLPKLKSTVDFSGIQVVGAGFVLKGLNENFNIKFPTKLEYLTQYGLKSPDGHGQLFIKVDEAMKENKAVKDYVTKHKMKWVVDDWSDEAQYLFDTETMGEWID